MNRIRHENNNAHHQTALLKQIRRSTALGVNTRQEEKKILDQVLDREVYDARMRPNGYNASDGPTIVNVNLYFRSFEKIDDVKMVCMYASLDLPSIVPCTLAPAMLLLSPCRLIFRILRRQA